LIIVICHAAFALGGGLALAPASRKPGMASHALDDCARPPKEGKVMLFGERLNESKSKRDRLGEIERQREEYKHKRERNREGEGGREREASERDKR